MVPVGFGPLASRHGVRQEEHIMNGNGEAQTSQTKNGDPARKERHHHQREVLIVHTDQATKFVLLRPKV